MELIERDGTICYQKTGLKQLNIGSVVHNGLLSIGQFSEVSLPTKEYYEPIKSLLNNKISLCWGVKIITPRHTELSLLDPDQIQHEFKFFNPNSGNKLSIVFTRLDKNDFVAIVGKDVPAGYIGSPGKFHLERLATKAPISTEWDGLVLREGNMHFFQCGDPFCCGIVIFEVHMKNRRTSPENLQAVINFLTSYAVVGGNNEGLILLKVENSNFVKALMEFGIFTWIGGSNYKNGVLCLKVDCEVEDDDDEEYDDDDDDDEY